MAKYRFSASDITGVLSHIVAYDATVLSMTPDGNGYYLIEVSVQFPPEEFEHLAESYDFVEVQ
jgi:hypothetical protein